MDNTIITLPENETIEFYSHIATAFFNALDECIRTGDVSDESITKIIGPPPMCIISNNPQTIDIIFHRRVKYYLKFDEMKKRILNMAHLKGAL